MGSDSCPETRVDSSGQMRFMSTLEVLPAVVNLISSSGGALVPTRQRQHPVGIFIVVASKSHPAINCPTLFQKASSDAVQQVSSALSRVPRPALWVCLGASEQPCHCSPGHIPCTRDSPPAMHQSR